MAEDGLLFVIDKKGGAREEEEERKTRSKKSRPYEDEDRENKKKGKRTSPTAQKGTNDGDDAKGIGKHGKKGKKAASDGMDMEEKWRNLLFGSVGTEADEEPAQDDDAGLVRHGGKDVPAWQDEDDKNVSVDIKAKDRLKKLRKTEEEEVIDGEEYSQRLRSQVLKVNNNVTWATRAAQVKSGDADEDGMNLLKSTARLTGSQSRLLPSAVLDVERMKDANVSDVPDCVIQALRFHPNSQLMLTGGLDKRLRLYQVDGKKNPKVQSVYFEDLPITSAEFSADGDEVFVSGRRKHFYVYNLAAAHIEKVEGILGHHDRVLGQFCMSPDNKFISILSTCGGVQILSRKTKQKIGDLKMNCEVNCCAYSSDGTYLYTAGDSPIVYQWDMRTRRCVRKIEDEGSLKISSLAVSQDGGLLACGSQNGVVNTYDVRGFHGHDPDAYGVIHPATRKSVMNLTTSVSQLRFSPDGQALAMASHVKKEALKILHVSSNSVFSNWPTSSTPLHYVSSVDFSANNRFLAIGNDRGKVLLYRLKHYL